jgi:hypothetical protein
MKRIVPKVGRINLTTQINFSVSGAYYSIGVKIILQDQLVYVRKNISDQFIITRGKNLRIWR